MPAVSRVGDSHTNHPPCSPGEAASGSGNVFVNSISVHRLTDPNTPHGFVLCVPHTTNLSSSSTTVFDTNGTGSLGAGGQLRLVKVMLQAEGPANRLADKSIGECADQIHAAAWSDYIAGL